MEHRRRKGEEQASAKSDEHEPELVPELHINIFVMTLRGKLRFTIPRSETAACLRLRLAAEGCEVDSTPSRDGVSSVSRKQQRGLWPILVAFE